MWSLRARRSGIGSDSGGSADQGAQEIRQREQGMDGDYRVADEVHCRAVFARRHPVGQEAPRPIRELTAEPATAVHRPLMARDRQRLAGERMPAVVDGYAALKLRSM